MDTLTPIQSLSADGIRDAIRRLCRENTSNASGRRRALSDFVSSVDWSGVDREPPPPDVLDLLARLERLSIEVDEGDISDAEFARALEALVATPRASG